MTCYIIVVQRNKKYLLMIKQNTNMMAYNYLAGV